MATLNVAELSTQLLSEDSQEAVVKLRDVFEAISNFSTEKCSIIEYAIQKKHEVLPKISEVLSEYYANKEEKVLCKVQYLFGEVLAALAANDSFKPAFDSACKSLISAADVSTSNKYVAQRAFIAASYAMSKADGSVAINALSTSLLPSIVKLAIAVVGKDAPITDDALTANALQLITATLVAKVPVALERTSEIVEAINETLQKKINLQKYFQIPMHIGSILDEIKDKSFSIEDLKCLLTPLVNALGEAIDGALKSVEDNRISSNASNALFFITYATQNVLNLIVSKKTISSNDAKSLSDELAKILEALRKIKNDNILGKCDQTRMISIFNKLFVSFIKLRKDASAEEKNSFFELSRVLNLRFSPDPVVIADYFATLMDTSINPKYDHVLHAEIKKQLPNLPFCKEPEMYIRDHASATFRYVQKSKNPDEERYPFNDAKKKMDDLMKTPPTRWGGDRSASVATSEVHKAAPSRTSISTGGGETAPMDPTKPKPQISDPNKSSNGPNVKRVDSHVSHPDLGQRQSSHRAPHPQPNNYKMGGGVNGRPSPSNFDMSQYGNGQGFSGRGRGPAPSSNEGGGGGGGGSPLVVIISLLRVPEIRVRVIMWTLLLEYQRADHLVLISL